VGAQLLLLTPEKVFSALVPLLLGVRLARVMPSSAARSLVVAIGALLTVAFAWRYWV